MERLFAFLFACALAAAAGATAADPPPAGSPADVIRRFVDDELARTVPQLRAEVNVGEVDSHLRVSACAQTEAFLRPGGRLWGRSYVGLRCLQTGGWTVFVPVTVRVYGKAFVVAHSLAAMQPIAPEALREEEIELSREPGGVATDPHEVEERACTRTLEPGQAIPLSCLRALPAIGQGETVKLIGNGTGFSIVTEGTALASAVAGESVRVRTESGRTVSGIARKGRVVEISF